jgi:hypothetical protein
MSIHAIQLKVNVFNVDFFIVEVALVPGDSTVDLSLVTLLGNHIFDRLHAIYL